MGGGVPNKVESDCTLFPEVSSVSLLGDDRRAGNQLLPARLHIIAEQGDTTKQWGVNGHLVVTGGFLLDADQLVFSKTTSNLCAGRENTLDNEQYLR